MVRTVAFVILLAAMASSPVSAQASPAPVSLPSRPQQQIDSPPATGPAMTATALSPAELHAQAYELMRAGDLDNAAPLLHRAYVELPRRLRDGRALMLNRALLDLMRRQTALHGIRELSGYLGRHPGHDEAASNILGSLLHLAAKNPRWRDSAMYNEAYREFARREVALERLRPGYRRWGPRWITEEEFKEIRRRQHDLMRQMHELYEKMIHLDAELTKLHGQMATSRRRVNPFGWHSHPTDVSVPTYIAGCITCEVQVKGVYQSVNDLMGQAHADSIDMGGYARRFEELKREYEKLQPEWPARYDAVDPSAPPPPPPANPPVAATAPSESQPAGPPATDQAKGASP